MTYTYVITSDPANIKTLPVTDYTSTISVKPSAAGSVATWMSMFKRADQGDAPAANMDDKTASGAIAGVYGAGLDGLKAKPLGRSVTCRAPRLDLCQGGVPGPALSRPGDRTGRF